MLTELFKFAVASIVVLCLYALPAGVSALLDRPEPVIVEAPVAERAAVFTVAIPSLVAEAEAATPAPAPRTTSARVSTTTLSKGTGSASHGRRRGRQEACMASTGEVRALGGGSYEVQRAMLDRYLRDTEAAEGLGSAAWHKDRQGKVDGIRVLRVRCGSPLAEAGLAKGDIVRSANGRSLDSLAGMVALWWQLRTKDRVTLELTRGGERRTLTYRLV
ncbi:MAG: PDZ domain-containing protein [Pseudomonadota bacterium]